MRFREIDETPGQPYTSLQDAGPDYAPGDTQVWYWKQDYARDLMMGYKFAVKQGVFDPNNIENTHTMVGTLAQTDPHQVWSLMQGEAWSPDGEARSMIQHLDVGHTTMAVGDIIIVSNRALMVDSVGFVDISTGEKV